MLFSLPFFSFCRFAMETGPSVHSLHVLSVRVFAEELCGRVFIRFSKVAHWRKNKAKTFERVTPRCRMAERFFFRSRSPLTRLTCLTCSNCFHVANWVYNIEHDEDRSNEFFRGLYFCFKFDYFTKSYKSSTFINWKLYTKINTYSLRQDISCEAVFICV